MTKQVLYLGLRSPNPCYTHCPMIQVIPKSYDLCVFRKKAQADFVILTSQVAVELFFKALQGCHISNQFLAVGEKTAEAIQRQGEYSVFFPSNETAEGVCELLKHLPAKTRLFYPHSCQSRTVIQTYCLQKDLQLEELGFYDVKPTEIPFDLKISRFDEIIFTSPSTVHAFFQRQLEINPCTTCIVQGEVTLQALQCYVPGSKIRLRQAQDFES